MEDLVTDEDAEETEDDQDDQADEKHTITGSEVILGLGEEGHIQVNCYITARSTSETDGQIQTCREKRTTVKHTTTVMPTAMITDSVS